MSEHNLARRTVSGVLWGLTSTAAVRAVGVVSLAVLARLLAPSEFGLLAFALVFLSYVETVGDLGTAMALIQRRGSVERAAQATFLVNLAMGVLWGLLTYAAAPAVAAFFHNPESAGVLRLMAWSFPIKALGNTHDALCQRDLRFRARLVPEVALAAVKAAVAISLAVAGHGAYALAWGQLAGVTASTALLWVLVPWRPARFLAREELPALLAYGRGIVAVNVMAAVVHHVDLVVVGRALGATALGLYQMAGRIPEMTIIVVMWVVSRALFPSLSRVAAQPERLQRAYLSALRYVSIVTVPTAVALAMLAEPATLLLFGGSWAEAGPILRALALYAGLRSLGSQAGDLLKATGHPGRLAMLSFVRAAVLVPALGLGLRYGPEGVAWGMTATAGLTFFVNLVVACRLTGTPVWEAVAAFRPSLLAALPLLPALWPWAAATSLPPVVRLAGGLVTGALAYGLALRLTAPDVFHEAGRVLRPRPVAASA